MQSQFSDFPHSNWYHKFPRSLPSSCQSHDGGFQHRISRVVPHPGEVISAHPVRTPMNLSILKSRKPWVFKCRYIVFTPNLLSTPMKYQKNWGRSKRYWTCGFTCELPQFRLEQQKCCDVLTQDTKAKLIQSM